MIHENPSERRSRVRNVVQGDLTGHVLARFQSDNHPGIPFHGKILDASAGGLCVFTFQVVSPSEPIQCIVNLEGSPVAVPTLVQVRWVEKADFEKGVRVGLQYLLGPAGF